MTKKYRNFSREEKIKAVKKVLIDKKSQILLPKIKLKTNLSNLYKSRSL